MIEKIEATKKEEKRRLRVAAYARVSEKTQRLLHSLAYQESYYTNLIRNNPEWEFVKVYSDEAITGTLIKNRAGFIDMINDCKKGKIDIILVKSISRFSRNTVDLLNTVRFLKSIGVEVIFEKENIRSYNMDGELMLTVLSSFAQEEARNISENVKWAAKKRFQEGIPNGKIRLYGYLWIDDNLKIISKEAEIVKRIFASFLDAHNPREIAKELNEDNIRTRSGCIWRDFGIRSILKNITYTGNLLFQKTYVTDPITKKRKMNKGELPQFFVPNSHEAIIEKKMFEDAQKRFKECERLRKGEV